jgi:pyridoxine 5-phosphate synthase
VIALSVNLNKIALLRNSREGERPNVVTAARTVLAAGAAGITVHPRSDQRHVRPADVVDLANLLRNEYPGIELNVEGNPFAGPRDNGYPGFRALVACSHPAQCTLVPDTDTQLTSDHGWDLAGDQEALAEEIRRHHAIGARVSLFMDPVPAQIDRAAALGADRIELYTGPFAEVVRRHGVRSDAARTCLERFRAAAQHATSIGLGVNAGHDLDLVNLPLFASIAEIVEVSIGHALVADALEMGLAAAVAAYLAAIAQGRRRVDAACPGGST